MEGEDLQVLELTKNIKNGFYVDAGCYHPTHLSNTFLLYKKNWNGINIDVSELSISLFNFMRSNDLNLNLAISNFEGEVTIYHQKKMSQLTTINKKISTERMQGKIKERKIKSQKLTTVLNNSKYKNRKIDFLNIDVEGVDLEVLKSLDFKVYKPRVICIEIIDKKIEDSKIYNYLKNLDYKKVWSSSSNISHIFVEKYNED